MPPSLAARVAASLARPAVDLRHQVPPVRAQGDRPLCVPIAISTTHEAERSRIGDANVGPFAAEALWQHCVDAGEAGDDGTTILAASDALADRGQPPESAWPYNDSLGAATEPEPGPAAHVDWHGAATLDLPLAHDGVEDLIETALATGFAVALMIELTDEFDWPEPDGTIAVPPITAPLGDFHAVVAVGVSTSADGTTRRLLVRNSWGPGWGAGGYGWLPIGYLVAFAEEAAVIDPRTLFTY